MASALLEKLKTVATEVKRSQIKDAGGSSWAAMAVEEDPQRRVIDILLVEAGAGQGEGRGGKGKGRKGMGGRGEGGRGRERGGKRAGVLKGESNGRIRWQSSLKERMSSAKPKRPRSVRESYALCPIKALARPPCEPWEEASAGLPNSG